MQPTGIANNCATPHAAQLTDVLTRFGIAVAVILAGMSALVPAAGAESTTPELLQAGASNGGVVTTTSGGIVEIGEIVTGQNTGNSIATGDISGPADLHGGEISYPTDVVITLIIEPSIATADGGDEGKAISADGASTGGDGNEGEEITIINRNDNRSNAKVVETSQD